MDKVTILVNLNFIIATFALLLEIILVLLLSFFAFYFLSNSFKNKADRFLRRDLRAHRYNFDKLYLMFVFVFSLFSAAMTLFYSEYLGIIPCALCWFERVFMYGLVVISATALYTRSEVEYKSVVKYIKSFAVLGAIIALYHHVLQITALSKDSHLPCPVSGGECSKMIIFEYGHITFPLLAFIVFSFFITLPFFIKILQKNN